MKSGVLNSVQRMQKSFMDKMFFIDKIFESIDTILDSGAPTVCSSGPNRC